MYDWVEGPVLRVIDGDTFDMRVEWVGKLNKEKYNNAERIRLAGVNAPELNTPGGQEAKRHLEQRLSGRCVHCDVQARDCFHRLVCNVEVVSCRQAG